MSNKQEKIFPELKKPPLAEVVCGVVFDSVPELDTLLLGVYWDTRKEDFPKRQLHPALSDEAGFTLGVVPMRAFLISADDQFIIQIQHDRFFMNWRAKDKEYPRFSERHGPRGLLLRMEEEFEKLKKFVQQRCAQELTPKRIELSKIDILERGTHWQNLEDLAKLLPVTGMFQDIQRSNQRDVNLRFADRGEDGTIFIHLATLTNVDSMRAVRIEARFVAPLHGTLRETFERSNYILNETFFKLIPDAQKHFGIKEAQ